MCAHMRMDVYIKPVCHADTLACIVIVLGICNLGHIMFVFNMHACMHARAANLARACSQVWYSSWAALHGNVTCCVLSWHVTIPQWLCQQM